MSVINPQFKPSRFRIESLGPELAFNPTYNPRYCYVGSEDYLNDILQLEQKEIEEQMIAMVKQQSLNMKEKSPTITTLAEKQQNNYKKKKVFDSADYFMQQQQKKELSLEQQQEDLLFNKYAASNLQFKTPLTKKQKKVFDSADYFLSLYKN